MIFVYTYGYAYITKHTCIIFSRKYRNIMITVYFWRIYLFLVNVNSPKLTLAQWTKFLPKTVRMPGLISRIWTRIIIDIYYYYYYWIILNFTKKERATHATRRQRRRSNQRSSFTVNNIIIHILIYVCGDDDAHEKLRSMTKFLCWCLPYAAAAAPPHKRYDTFYKKQFCVCFYYSKCLLISFSRIYTLETLNIF